VEVEWREDLNLECKGEIAGERAWTDFGNRGLFEADRYRGLSVLSQSSRKSRVDTSRWVTVEENR
jgi:hypothetical protein